MCFASSLKRSSTLLKFVIPRRPTQKTAHLLSVLQRKGYFLECSMMIVNGYHHIPIQYHHNVSCIAWKNIYDGAVSLLFYRRMRKL